MKIRLATPTDIPGIKRLVDALQVSRNNPNWEERTSGFFEYKKSEQDLLESINPYFTVAQADSGLRGFILAYDDSFLQTLYERGEGQEWGFLLEEVARPFLYIDQLGVVNPETFGSGRVANDLAEDAFSRAKSAEIDRVVAYVCEQPLHNKVSARFVSKKGLERFAEVPIEDGVVLGAYQRGF